MKPIVFLAIYRGPISLLYLSRSACMTEDRANLVGFLLNGGGNSRIHNKIKAHERMAKKSG